MEQNKQTKEAKMAMNARMLLFAAGIFLVLNAVTSTAREGLNWFALARYVTETPETTEEAVREDKEETENTKKADAAEASEETASDDASEASEETASADAAAEEQEQPSVEEIKAQMEAIGITIADLRILGIACLIMAFIRILVGVVCVKYSNRVDRASLTLKFVIGLAAAEVIYIIFLLVKRAFSLWSVLYTLILLAFLLWGAIRMNKLAKLYPDRVYALETRKQYYAKAEQAPKKSIRDHAMVNTDIEAKEQAEEAASDADASVEEPAADPEPVQDVTEESTEE